MALVVGLLVAIAVAAVAVAVALRADRPDRDPAAGPDRHWRWHGLVYADRDNPTIFVPKRHGLGWTLNFGRPLSWVILLALIAIPTLVAATHH